MKTFHPLSESIQKATLLLVITILLGCASTEKNVNKPEKGPDGTIAYAVHVETSEAGVRIEVDGNYVGVAPLNLKIYGDKDGTFHNFGSVECVIRATPSGGIGQEQVKVFKTGGFFTQEDRIPKSIFFSMTAPQLERTASQPNNGPQRLLAGMLFRLSQSGDSSTSETKPGKFLFANPTVAAQAREPGRGNVLFTDPTVAAQVSPHRLSIPPTSNGTSPIRDLGNTKLMLFGGEGHKTYLGCISCDLDAEDSIFNPDGPKGKSSTGKYSQESIWNDHGPFGGTFSDKSPWNKFGHKPPIIVDQDGNAYGYFTVNEFYPQRTTVPELQKIIQMIRPE